MHLVKARGSPMAGVNLLCFVLFGVEFGCPLLCYVAGGGKVRACPHVLHGRSRMTVDPRIPTRLGRSSLGFH